MQAGLAQCQVGRGALLHMVSHPPAAEPGLVHAEVAGFLERGSIQSLLRSSHGRWHCVIFFTFCLAKQVMRAAQSEWEEATKSQASGVGTRGA